MRLLLDENLPVALASQLGAHEGPPRAFVTQKAGIDIAIEALRDFSQKYPGQATELARCARICRVARVMQPYLDAIA